MHHDSPMQKVWQKEWPTKDACSLVSVMLMLTEAVWRSLQSAHMLQSIMPQLQTRVACDAMDLIFSIWDIAFPSNWNVTEELTTAMQ